MKKLLTLSILLLLMSCQTNVEQKSTSIEIYGHNMYEFTIEGCQYIGFGFGSFGEGSNTTISHKGNCSNPIHNHKCDTVTRAVHDTIYLPK